MMPAGDTLPNIKMVVDQGVGILGFTQEVSGSGGPQPFFLGYYPRWCPLRKNASMDFSRVGSSSSTNHNIDTIIVEFAIKIQ